jgi:hypothetical protein
MEKGQQNALALWQKHLRLACAAAIQRGARLGCADPCQNGPARILILPIQAGLDGGRGQVFGRHELGIEGLAEARRVALGGVLQQRIAIGRHCSGR